MEMHPQRFRNRVRRSYVVSTVSIALVLFLLGSVGYMTYNVFRASDTMRSSICMIIELDDGMSETEADSIAAVLERQDMVENARFCSKEEKIADEKFQEAFDTDLSEVFDTNPLPNSIDVTLAEEAKDSVALHRFISSCDTIRHVTRIDYPEAELRAVHSALDKMETILLLLGGTLLAVSLILLGNTLRLTIYSRREMINTMKLVGATRWCILRPFLGAGLIQGAVAGILATLMFTGALYCLDSEIPELATDNCQMLIIQICGIMLACGMAIAVLFTYFTVSRFIRMNSNKIYLY